MKKYLEIAKIHFKMQLIYRFDTMVSIVFTISKIILAYLLWGGIFHNRDIVSGFTFNEMISYYVISAFMAQLDQSSSIGGQISQQIRDGQFSKYMIKPIHIFGYFTFQTVGISVFLLFFNFIAAVLWIFVFQMEFIITREVTLILSGIIMCMLGLLFMVQLNFFIGILAFKFIDTSIFMMIKDNVVQFVTGSLIPLMLLPSFALHIMRCFPFYYIIYVPTMLFLGKNQNEIFTGIVILLLWNLCFVPLNSISYNKLRNKYDGVGI